MSKTILRIDNKKYEINDLTPFLIAILDLVYDGKFANAEKDLKNTKLEKELVTVKKLFDIYPETISQDNFSPVDFSEFKKYLEESEFDFSYFKNGTFNGFTDKVMALANNGNYKSAQSFLEAFKESNFSTASIYELMGTLYLEEGKIEKGINYLQESIGINPNLDTAYSELGNAYYNEKKFDLAAEYWLKEIEISPDHLYTYFMVHDSLKKCGEDDAARDILLKLLKNYPDNLLAKYHLMEYYIRTDQKDQADKMKSEIINSIPKYSNDFEIWSKIQYENENYSEVIDVIDSHISTNPNSAYLIVFKVVPLIKMNRYVDAIITINQLKENHKWYYYGKNDFFLNYLSEKERKICGI